MIRNYYYRVSYHDDNQSAGSLLKQPMRDKSAVVSSLGPRWRNTVTENIMVMMTAKLTKQPRNMRMTWEGLSNVMSSHRGSWMQCAKPLGRASEGESVTGILRV